LACVIWARFPTDEPESVEGYGKLEGSRLDRICEQKVYRGRLETKKNGSFMRHRIIKGWGKVEASVQNK